MWLVSAPLRNCGFGGRTTHLWQEDTLCSVLRGASALSCVWGQVVHRNGEWRTANEDALCEGMQWRYFVRAKLMDCTEECDVLLSNDQVMTAAPALQCLSAEGQPDDSRSSGGLTHSCCLSRASALQAEKLLKLKGDELHEIRESNPNEFEAVLLGAQFTEWTLTIKSNTS